jgi:membrane associated rhomboid family serine protease
MRLPDSWKKARVTAWIAAVTAAAWLIVSLLNADLRAAIWGGFIPARLAYGGDEMLAPFLLTPLTATLIHASALHLIFNMIILLYCGRPVEAMLGPWSMAILYLLGAYAAAGAHYLVNPLSIAPMVGASGAVSAVIGAYAMLFGRNKVKVANRRLALWLNALWLLAAWVALQVCLGIIMAGPGFLSGEGVQIAAAAHIGGFLVGLLLANPLLLFRYRKA